jgi:hypothetical protein
LSETSVSFNDSARTTEQRDLLPVVVQILYVVAPLEILMVYAGTTELNAGMVVGGGIGVIGWLLFASSRLGLSWREDRSIIYMLLFLCLGALSTSLTVYGMPAIQKGVINLLAILAMVGMVMVVKQALIQWPHLFPHIVRIAAVTTGVAGLTVIFQSFVSNVLGQPDWFDLSFLNTFWGQLWWRFSPQGGLARAQGIYAEPSSVAAYIGMASGLALVRLGLAGPRWRNEIRSFVPAWTAASVLASIILSFSAVAYAGLFAAYLGTLATRITFSVRSIVLLVMGSAVAAALLALAAVQAGETIRDRFIDLVVLNQLGDASGNNAVDRETNLSVQVLFLNAYVTLENFAANPWLGAGVGAHPFAYQALVPALPLASSSAIGLNAMDANALALRLLSETGILGTAIFTAAVLSAWLRTRRIVLTRHSGPSLLLRALAIGLNGGLAGVFAAKMFRLPNYYSAEFWALFALCVAVPALASMSASVVRERYPRNA